MNFCQFSSILYLLTEAYHDVSHQGVCCCYTTDDATLSLIFFCAAQCNEHDVMHLTRSRLRGGGFWGLFSNSGTACWILFIFGRLIDMVESSRFPKIHNPRLDILNFIKFLHYHGNPFVFFSTFCYKISVRSVEKRRRGRRTGSQRLLLLLYDNLMTRDSRKQAPGRVTCPLWERRGSGTEKQ